VILTLIESRQKKREKGGGEPLLFVLSERKGHARDLLRFFLVGKKDCPFPLLPQEGERGKKGHPVAWKSLANKKERKKGKNDPNSPPASAKEWRKKRKKRLDLLPVLAGFRFKRRGGGRKEGKDAPSLISFRGNNRGDARSRPLVAVPSDPVS